VVAAYLGLSAAAGTWFRERDEPGLLSPLFNSQLIVTLLFPYFIPYLLLVAQLMRSNRSRGLRFLVKTSTRRDT
jgi:hypothetical protein